MNSLQIIDTDATNIQNYGMCGYKNIKQEGYRLKLEWINNKYKEGMKYKMLVDENNKALGGIEYIPGEYAWRPVKATGYMFIHCIFIMQKKYKEQGYGQKMLESCIGDARAQKMKGVAIVTRKGTWMAKKDLYIKNGFEIVDKAKPDFELLALKFDSSFENPSFVKNWDEKLKAYKGLNFIISDQCPYIHKSISEMIEIAENEYKITPNIIELKTAKDAQNVPAAFGTFSLINNGKVLAYNPISSTRFKNIMNKL